MAVAVVMQGAQTILPASLFEAVCSSKCCWNTSAPELLFCCAAVQSCRVCAHLHASFGEQDTGADTVDATAVTRLLHMDIDNVLHTLSPRECGVLRMRYGLDDGQEKTLEEVGARFKARPPRTLAPGHHPPVRASNGTLWVTNTCLPAMFLGWNASSRAVCCYWSKRTGFP